ncbi:MAG: general secretion pathway protein GspB [Burkholderiales bacterium]
MSYILDALRKADAERDRGTVPGIHAQPSFGGAMPTRAQPAARPWLWLAGGGAAVAVVGALAWYLMSPSHGASEAALPAPTPIAAAPVVAAPAPVAPLPAAPVHPITPRAEAAPVVRKRKPTTMAASTQPAAPLTSAVSAVDAKPAASGEKVYTLAELPDDIRRQLPNVTVGGSMYSTKPADRILIINGQVLHEGDKIAPELALLQIRLKGALLSFKGYRYTIGF